MNVTEALDLEGPRGEPMNLFAKIIAYESGDVDWDDDQLISFFEELRDTGVLFSLQGHYQRTARSLGVI